MQALRDAAAVMQSDQPDQSDQSEPTSSSVVSGEESKIKEDEEKSQILLALGAMLAREPSSAAQVRRGTNEAFFGTFSTCFFMARESALMSLPP